MCHSIVMMFERPWNFLLCRSGAPDAQTFPECCADDPSLCVLQNAHTHTHTVFNKLRRHNVETTIAKYWNCYVQMRFGFFLFYSAPTRLLHLCVCILCARALVCVCMCVQSAFAFKGPNAIWCRHITRILLPPPRAWWTVEKGIFSAFRGRFSRPRFTAFSRNRENLSETTCPDAPLSFCFSVFEFAYRLMTVSVRRPVLPTLLVIPLENRRVFIIFFPKDPKIVFISIIKRFCRVINFIFSASMYVFSQH